VGSFGAAALLFGSALVYGATGTISFHGIATAFAGDGNNGGYDIAVQSDGKIVAVGTCWSGGTTLVTVLRFTSAGVLDTTFGGGDGTVTVDIDASYDSGRAVAIQNDGKIVVGGYGDANPDPAVSYLNFVVARLNSDGSLDTTFNGTGKRVIDLGGNADLKSVSIQADGKILLGGQASFSAAFVRLTANGALDTTFNGTGSLIVAGNSAGMATVLQSDGRILSVGSVSLDSLGADSDLLLIRRNVDGTADASFGTAVNTLDNTPAYVEGSTPVVLDGDVSIFDNELSGYSFSGATLTLARQGGANAGDTFSASGSLGALTEGGNLAVGGTVVGTVTRNSGGTLLLTFTGSSNETLVNSTMRQIAYSTNTAAPGASLPIEWTFSDGNTGSQGTGEALSVTGSTTVTIAAGAPRLSPGRPQSTAPQRQLSTA
jgi:uncharacterized delta-60 repeat protein